MRGTGFQQGERHPDPPHLRHVPTFPLWDRAGGVVGRRQAAADRLGVGFSAEADAVVFAPPGGARRKATGHLAVLLLLVPVGRQSGSLRPSSTSPHAGCVLPCPISTFRTRVEDTFLRMGVYLPRAATPPASVIWRVLTLLFACLMFWCSLSITKRSANLCRFCRSCTSVSTGRRSPRNGYRPFNQIRRRRANIKRHLGRLLRDNGMLTPDINKDLPHRVRCCTWVRGGMVCLPQ